MTRFTLKVNVFPSISLESPEMCVVTIRTGFVFTEMIDLRGHMPRFSWKITCFSIYLLGNIINVCWNPQNMAHFIKMINLKGHMTRFTLKVNVFPSISLESPEMCVETVRTGLVLPRWSIWSVTCLGWLWKMNVFPIYLLGNPINVCWNPQDRACFSKMINLRGHKTRFSWKMNVFPSICLETARNVCWNSQNRARFSKMIDLRGSHA